MRNSTARIAHGCPRNPDRCLALPTNDITQIGEEPKKRAPEGARLDLRPGKPGHLSKSS
jgi:hypothetical protein